MTEQGNFVDHSDPDPLPRQNVLSIVDPELSESEKLLLESAKKKMFETRSKRVRPHLDDKVLASWNGLMLGALARAYAVLGDVSYRVAAEKNLAFIQAKLWVPAGKAGELNRTPHSHKIVRRSRLADEVLEQQVQAAAAERG